MKQLVIRNIVLSLVWILFLSACASTGINNPTQNPNPAHAYVRGRGHEALREPAKMLVLPGVATDQFSHTTPTPEEISFDQQVATAVAETQTAQPTAMTFDQQVATAYALTLTAQASSLSLDERIQTAIAKTQVAQGVILGTPTPQNYIASSVPDPLFVNAYVYKYGFLSGNKYNITIQLENDVSGDYFGVIAGEEYTCKVISGYPDRLYCNGASVPGGSQIINVYEKTTNRLVYSGQVVLPQWTPTRRSDYYYPWVNGWWHPPCSSSYPYYCDDWKNGCSGNNCYYNNNYYSNYCNHNSCTYTDYSGKCYYFDNKGVCRYCKTGNVCRNTCKNCNWNSSKARTIN